MICISVSTSEKGTINKIQTIGHASKNWFWLRVSPGAAKWNALCSAVSVLEYNFLYSVEALLNVKCKVEIRNGFFDMEVSDKADQEKLKLLSDSLLIGLSSLKNKYPNQVKLDL